MKYYSLGLTLTLIALSPFFSSRVRAENYRYSELQIKDLDEMTNEVKNRLNKAKQISLERQSQKRDEEGDHEAVEILRDSLKLVLSRPNDDNMLSNLLPIIRSELNNFNAFEDTLVSITQEAIRSINNDKLATVYRSTSLFILENIMSEIRPELSSQKSDFKRIFELIRDAKIEVPEKVKNERVLRSMYSTKNPSAIAAAILKKDEAKVTQPKTSTHKANSAK